VIAEGSIQKFTPDGQVSGYHGKWTSALALLAIKVLCDRHLFRFLNSDFTFSGIFENIGDGVGQFDYPAGVACMWPIVTTIVSKRRDDVWEA
jgi:hypothetical protein